MLCTNAVTYDQKSYFFGDYVMEMSLNNAIEECQFSDKFIKKYIALNCNPMKTK